MKSSLSKRKKHRKKSAIKNGGDLAVIGGDIREQILGTIRYDNTMSAFQIAQVIKSSKRTVERCIKKLRDEGVIERHGAACGGYWEIKE